MGAPKRYVPKDRPKRLWILLGVGVFLVVDAVLIAVAMGATHARSEASETLPVASAPAAPASAEPQPAGTVETTPAASPEPAAIVAVPSTRLLAALDGSIAWRATTGACPDASASPELTADGGYSWKTTDATGFTDVTALQRILVTGETRAAMVGLSAEGCEPQFVETYVSGDNYVSYPDELESTWFTTPSTPSTVHSPAGDLSTPCTTVVALAPRDADVAGVLCADGRVFQTTDAAATWSDATPVAGAVDLAATDSGYVVAIVGDPACKGVALRMLPAGDAQDGCYALDADPETLPGNVAVSAADGTLWLWAGDAIARSGDGGVTWE
ncbi:beta propeller repeat protein [Cryobacterium tepidiphilum]|uniref:Exo-alpha-sialidase n=1 Tax=Cryobacterium tepidiphilum TaxID=2486026 RepID=A0A3M8LB95_9MICO|nr:hypothetical protein [Cryobacterium tepidiphilum]RNE62595.1 hypothetical protein EEJ31_07110 [Cryobacterium tepidiphilum]